MILVADADLQEPVVVALKAVKYPIVRYDELDFPVRPDGKLMGKILAIQGVMITRDLGVPSQAYAYEYAQHGLSVILMRWKQSQPKDWQEMVLAILRDSDDWERIVANKPSVISVNRRRYRARAWEDIPTSIVYQSPSPEGGNAEYLK